MAVNDPAMAKRIGRGRAIALSYAGMTGLEMDLGVGIDTAVADCIADLLHAAVAEPFSRAGLGVGEKEQIARRLADKGLEVMLLELREVEA